MSMTYGQNAFGVESSEWIHKTTNQYFAMRAERGERGRESKRWANFLAFNRTAWDGFVFLFVLLRHVKEFNDGSKFVPVNRCLTTFERILRRTKSHTRTPLDAIISGHGFRYKAILSCVRFLRIPTVCVHGGWVGVSECVHAMTNIHAPNNTINIYNKWEDAEAKRKRNIKQEFHLKFQDEMKWETVFFFIICLCE